MKLTQKQQALAVASPQIVVKYHDLSIGQLSKIVFDLKWEVVGSFPLYDHRFLIIKHKTCPTFRVVASFVTYFEATGNPVERLDCVMCLELEHATFLESQFKWKDVFYVRHLGVSASEQGLELAAVLCQWVVAQGNHLISEDSHFARLPRKLRVDIIDVHKFEVVEKGVILNSVNYGEEKEHLRLVLTAVLP